MNTHTDLDVAGQSVEPVQELRIEGVWTQSKQSTQCLQQNTTVQVHSFIRQNGESSTTVDCTVGHF